MLEFECILLKPCLLQPCFHVAGFSIPLQSFAKLLRATPRVSMWCRWIRNFIFSNNNKQDNKHNTIKHNTYNNKQHTQQNEGSSCHLGRV